jgi:hypothetical protein
MIVRPAWALLRRSHSNHHLSIPCAQFFHRLYNAKVSRQMQHLHPPAIRVLRELGTDLPSAIPEHAAVPSAGAFEGAANGVRGDSADEAVAAPCSGA